MSVDKVQHNVEMPPGRFDLPEDIKKLAEKQKKDKPRVKKVTCLMIASNHLDKYPERADFAGGRSAKATELADRAGLKNPVPQRGVGSAVKASYG